MFMVEKMPLSLIFEKTLKTLILHRPYNIVCFVLCLLLVGILILNKREIALIFGSSFYLISGNEKAIGNHFFIGIGLLQFMGSRLLCMHPNGQSAW
jgi:hypothetical protein